MGKHAAPRTPLLRSRTAQRAVTVSAGTFVLCMGAAAPAIATTGLPTPPPLPQPIVDTVQTVSDIAGIPNPLAPETPTKTHHHHAAKQDSSKPTVTAPRETTTRTTPPKAAVKPAAPTYVAPALPVGGLRAEPATRTAPLDDRAPTMAKAPTITRIVQTAGERALDNIPGVPPTEDTARILAVALAMTIVGGLTSGHIKAAQSRALA